MTKIKSLPVIKRALFLGFMVALVSNQCLAAEAMAIIPSGQVGIGTSLPEATLEVLGDNSTVGVGNAVVKLKKDR